MKFIVLAICLLAHSLFSDAFADGWAPSGVWPSSNHVFLASTLGAPQEVTLVTGSTQVSTNSTTWNYITGTFTNQPMISQIVQSNVFNAYVLQSNVWIKTALPIIPSNGVVTNTWLTNFCIRPAVSNSCAYTQIFGTYTNSVTNTCLIPLLTNQLVYGEIVRTNYYWGSPLVLTNANTNLVTNVCVIVGQTNSIYCGSGSNTCISLAVSNSAVSTNINISIYFNPAKLAVVVTNLVAVTNCYYSVACLTNPGSYSVSCETTNTCDTNSPPNCAPICTTNATYRPPYTWAWTNPHSYSWMEITNVDGSPVTNTMTVNFDAHANLTNIPQLQGVISSLLSNDQFVLDSTTNSIRTVSGLSDFFPTNKNANTDGLWTLDITLAINEHETTIFSDGMYVSLGDFQSNIFNATPWQRTLTRFGADNNDTEYSNVPQWKSWILSHAAVYVIDALADTDGTFDSYCAAPQTNRVWNAFAGQKWWNGTSIYTETNYWGTNITYRPPPMYSDAWYWKSTTGAPTQNKPHQNAIPLTLAEKLVWFQKLPGWNMPRVPMIVTNRAVCSGPYPFYGFDGWQVGFPFVQTTNSPSFFQVATNYASVCGFFGYSPDLHFSQATPPSTNAAASWGGNGHLLTNVFRIAPPWPAWGSVTATNPVITPLTIRGGALTLGTTYVGTNPWTWTPYGYNFNNSLNSLTYGYSVTGQVSVYPVTFTNWVTVTTNRYSLADSVPGNCASNLYTFLRTNVTHGVTNIATLTNIVLTCAFTNTTSVKVDVTRSDWLHLTEAYTMMVDYWVESVSLLDTNILIGTNSLLSCVLTNTSQVTNCTTVATNWNVATGQLEADYQIDSVRRCLTNLTRIVVSALDWYNTGIAVITSNDVPNCTTLLLTNTLYILNRYGSNAVASLLDTNSMGALWYIRTTITTATITTNFSGGDPCDDGSYTYTTNGLTEYIATNGCDFTTNYLWSVTNTIISAPSVYTNDLAAAQAMITFTNINTAALPMGLSYATNMNLSGPQYIKKNWTLLVYSRSSPIGTVVHYCADMVGPMLTNYVDILYCDSTTPVHGDPDTLDCHPVPADWSCSAFYCRSCPGRPTIIFPCTCANATAQDAINLCQSYGGFYAPDHNGAGSESITCGFLDGSLITCTNDISTWSTITVSDCNLGGVLSTIAPYVNDASFGGGAQLLKYSMWPDQTPANFAYCCVSGGIANYVTGTWTAGNTYTDSTASAYAFVQPAVIGSGAVINGVYLNQPQQSSGGAFTDILNKYAHASEVYLSGEAPSFSYSRKEKLPVPASVSSNWVAVYYNPPVGTNTCPTRSSDYPKQWTYYGNGIVAQATSNVWGVVTNISWPQRSIWSPPSEWTGTRNCYDDTNALSIFQSFRVDSPVATNTVAVPEFLSTTPLVTSSSADGKPYGWKVNDVRILLNWNVVNGLPHRSAIP